MYFDNFSPRRNKEINSRLNVLLNQRFVWSTRKFLCPSSSFPSEVASREISLLCISLTHTHARQYNSLISGRIYARPLICRIARESLGGAYLSRGSADPCDKKSQSGIEIPLGFKVSHLHTRALCCELRSLANAPRVASMFPARTQTHARRIRVR